MNGAVVEKDNITRLCFEGGGVFDWILVQLTLAHRAGQASQLVAPRINPEASHFVVSIGKVDDSRHHRVVKGGEILPVLMHREGSTIFGWLLEKFGVVKHHVRANDCLGGGQKIWVQQGLHPPAAVLLNVVGVEYNRIGCAQPVNLRARPSSVDVFAGGQQLSDNSVKIKLELGQLLTAKNAFGHVESLLGKLGFDIVGCDHLPQITPNGTKKGIGLFERMRSKAKKAVETLKNAVKGTPYETALYLVGGVVRDELLERHDQSDVDIASEIPLGPLIERMLNSRILTEPPHIYPRFGTAMVRIEGVNLEFATMRRESYSAESRKPIVKPASIAEDALRRDFTVNSVYRRLSSDELLDPTGSGLIDIQAGLLRTPRDPITTFIDDPLRMFRAVRFRWKLGLRPAAGLYESIRSQTHRVEVLSMERVRDEVLQMMDLPNASLAMQDLLELGLLDRIAPELTAMKGVSQGGFHHRDVWGHSCLVMDRLWQITHPSRVESLAALFHDIGKPRTRTIDEDGIRFFKHESVGAEMTTAVLKRWKLSADVISSVSTIVKNHMRLGHAQEYSDAAIRRLIRDVGLLLPPLLNVVQADTMSLKPGIVTANMREIRDRIEQVSSTTPAELLESPLDGREIIAQLGIAPGPEVGQWKKLLLDRVLEGDLQPRDKEKARAILAEAYSARSDKSRSS